MKRRPQIGLIVETTFASGREVLRGISKYIIEHEPWSVFLGPGQLDQSLPRWIENWEGDGFIARVSNQEVLETIRNTGLPVVDVLGELEQTGIPLVAVDNQSVATIAFQHLAERGYQSFAFVGVHDYNWSSIRERTFCQLAASKDFDCRTLLLGNRLSRTPWDVEQQLLAEWLRELPRPCGLMACNDGQGQRVLEACHRANIAVPEELAVIGVDDDHVVCDLAIPALSSIDPGHFHVGFQSADLLRRRLAGEAVPDLVQVPAAGCIIRESTEISAVNDPVLAKALAFIRKNACFNIGSRDVANHVSISLSSLKRRFAAKSNKTINEWILSIKLDRASRLLRETDLSIEQVASRSGYADSTYFSTSFRRQLGESPSNYRSRNRRSIQ